ncbi:hypothetical protein BJAS_P0275 [Bathymodiolus japonicus methanotrophic gill symbiont]|nr:hypothetical protein BJAS_P0275 [Bathymodiolus japonicus methanotrophic gill symbiont]
MSYTHLCPEERYYIEIELKKGTSQNKIAEALEQSQSNISREIKRNTGQRGDRHKQQARHATSRNSGTPVAVIRSPTQRIGDAPAALRPPQTEHKAAQSWLPQMALRLFGIKF